MSVLERAAEVAAKGRRTVGSGAEYVDPIVVAGAQKTIVLTVDPLPDRPTIHVPKRFRVRTLAHRQRYCAHGLTAAIRRDVIGTRSGPRYRIAPLVPCNELRVEVHIEWVAGDSRVRAGGNVAANS